jgi:putative ABC transport system permease protein
MADKPLGFNKDAIIQLEINAALAKNIESFRTSIKSNSSIIDVTASTRVPGLNFWQWDVEINNKETSIHINSVDPDFIKTYKLELLEGRNFDWNIKNDNVNKLILNETAKKYFDLENAVGEKAKELPNYTGNGEIIGVINDFHFQSLHHQVKPLILYWHPDSFRHLSIKLHSKNISRSIAVVEDAFKKACPNHPFAYQFLSETFDDQYKNEAKLLNNFEFLSLISILIACLGLFGLATFLLEQRTKEIGIRKVNGASTLSILFLLVKNFMKLILIAFVIACPIAYFVMNNWLGNFAFRISLSIDIFIFACIIANVIGIISIGYQAY